VAVTLRYEMSTHKHLAVRLAVRSDDMVAEVRAQLDKILSSSSFSVAARPSCFLRFVVDKTLSGEADRLKEYVLGVEVFGRKPSFDPRIDPIVRVEAGRLRKRLEEYYETEGRRDGLFITLPKGGYVPTFERREQPSEARQPRRLWRLPAWIMALGVALLTAAAAAVWLYRYNSEAQDQLATVPLTSYPGQEKQASFSPDGNQVAFVWNGEKQDNYDIYVKLIGSGTQLRLTTNPEADIHPAWSPDGRSIAFVREGSEGKASLYLISPLGPPERKVAEVKRADRLAWTPDGKSLVITDRNTDDEPWGLFLLSVESGERRRLTTAPEKRIEDLDPALSADGRTLAFSRQVGIVVSDIYLLSLSKDLYAIGEPKRLTFENQWTIRPVWNSDGREIICSSGPYANQNLFRVAASGSGKLRRLASVGEDGYEAAISSLAHRLAYTRGSFDSNIWRVEVPSPHGKTSPAMELISSTRDDVEAQFSPDGKRIVFDSSRSGSDEIWVCDTDGSHAVQLTSFGIGNSGAPR